jgi:hypothetical protein
MVMGATAMRRTGRGGMVMLVALLLVLVLAGCSRGSNSDIYPKDGPTAVPVTEAAGGAQVESAPTSTGPCLSTPKTPDITIFPDGSFSFTVRSGGRAELFSATLYAYSNCSAHTLNKDFRGTLHFAAVKPGAVLPPDYTYTAKDSGIHSFGFRQQSGPQTIIVTSSVPGYSTRFTASFT